MTAEAAEHISDLQFTEAYRVPFQYSRLVREHLAPAPSCNPRPASPSPTSTAMSLRLDRLLRRQHFRQRLLQGVHHRRRSAPVRWARCSAPITPSSPTTSNGCARFPGSTKSRSTCPAPRRSCRRCGSRVTTPAHASGSFRRRLSRLVGRRAARRRQPGVAARDLYACRHVRADAACPADAPRHRLRAGQSAAGAASQRQCARRLRRWSIAREANFDRAAYSEWLKALRAGLHRAQHRADLRRGVCRLPPRAPVARRNISASAPTW